jgi:hemerythrin
MKRLTQLEVTPGISWIEVPELDLRVLCGCPGDSVKHLIRRNLIRPTEVAGVPCDSGPNAILLSDVMVQNGAFCNMAEFPVLQMLYRQGMILPDHPNNKGIKPLLIGRRDAVESQMQYIYRGNYGLISEEEMVAAGASPEQARTMMRLKLKFAFGRIQHPREMIDTAILDDGGGAIQLRDGLSVRRVGHNVFEFGFQGERERVDLNLPPFEGYECPYPLGAYQFARGYFSVVHTGEGDGWDIQRPSMGAILVYQGRIYLIDAGPNLPHTLAALGIGVNEIEGIFHTHGHDDHFGGLPALIQGDQRVKYFATPLVRASVSKKLTALLGIDDREFQEYFDVVDLRPEEWNDINGLQVRPVVSPHPVETTIFFFRTLATGGWRTYAHLADIASFKTLDAMVTADPAQPGLDRAAYDRVRAAYLEPADVKKVDIGGGMIHGDAADFRDDPSGKIILAHTALKLSDDQKQIGSGGSFGTVDVLVPSHRDFTARSAFYHLTSYFPDVSRDHVAALLNAPIRTFNPETILFKEGQEHSSIFLLLTGQVEMLHSQSSFRSIRTSGALLGEMSGLYGLPMLETCRAVTFVQAFDIPCDLYVRFVETHELFADMSQLMKMREFLQHSWLCSGIMATSALNAIAKAMTIREFAAGQPWEPGMEAIGIVKSGRMHRTLADAEIEILGPGDSFGEEAAFAAPAATSVTAIEPSEVALIPVSLVRAIPSVRWKLFESFERHVSLEAASASAARHLLKWQDDYRINVHAIDKQHQRLLGIASRLLTEVETGKPATAIGETLDRLVAYARHHFIEEQRLLREYGYETTEHTDHHQTLMVQLEKVCAEVLEGTIPSVTLHDFLREWALDHILLEDWKFGPFLNQRGVY